ncbi:MAG: hypothetical protein WDN07_02285 [Actinomycetota bacterium]
MPSFEQAFGQPIDLREVEFRNNGVTDSLTETMAPTLFHEALKREIASAKRDQRDIAVLAISLKPQRFGSISEFQEALIEIAFALRMGLRGGDFFSRISDAGFWALVRTSELHGETIINRLDLPHHDAIESYIVARKYDEYTEWIDRIDHLYFT